jgi:predicted metal-dependent enzyme (double-stranded beta helix superfamily)
MGMTTPFERFISGVESVVSTGGAPAEVVERIEPLMRELVRERTWLDEKYRRPIPGKPYSQYLLHVAPDRSFSVVSFVWAPGEGSPIHDHRTWGVIGQYEGEEEETRYRLLETGLHELGVAVFHPGDVGHVYPPTREVHRIRNRTQAPAVSVHVYGGDIGAIERHAFDPKTGASRPFVSGYDEPSCGNLRDA